LLRNYLFRGLSKDLPIMEATEGSLEFPVTIKS
jgi:hypothetical protein